MRARPFTRRLAGATAVLAVLAFLPRPAAALPVPSTPGELIEELNAAVRGQAEIYNWRSKLDQNYNNWKVGGSMNLPVIATAVGLVRGGMTFDPVAWWTTFLTCQNGGTCSVPSPGALIYFKGTEMASNTYDWAVVSSVATVHWWARTHNNTALQDAARFYLKKTWAFYTLAAGNGPSRNYRDDIDDSGNVTGDGSGPYVHRCQVTTGGTFYFNGPFMALGAPRSQPSYYCSDNRGVLLAVATAWPMTKNQQEDAREANLRSYIESHWPGNVQGENVYALDTATQTTMRTHITSGNQAAALVSILNSNGATRFTVPMHFLGWSNQVRVSVLTDNPNPNTKGAVYAILFDPSISEAHTLYPWRQSASSGFQRGYGRLLPAVAPTYVEAWNTNTDIGETPPPQHPGIPPLRFNLPAGAPQYHVVVGPDGPAFQM
jgi:hypothetical protein